VILVQHEDCYTNGCIESWDVCHSEMHLTNLIGGGGFPVVTLSHVPGRFNGWAAAGSSIARMLTAKLVAAQFGRFSFHIWYSVEMARLNYSSNRS
jgi:hypothetical protein